jgi:hypothetical protein
LHVKRKSQPIKFANIEPTQKKKLADDEQWPNLPQRRNREKSNFYGNDTTTQAKARIPNRINIFL